MSASILREAAEAMHADAKACGDLLTDFIPAVADWLNDAAENLDLQSPNGALRANWDMRVHVAGDKALTVALAYLGRAA